MLIKAKALKHYHLNCLDGDIGRVKEFYFDDHFWTIRYLVIETGHLFSQKDVLVSPEALDGILNDDEQVILNLSKEKIENSPSIDFDKPVSRQFKDEKAESLFNPHLRSSARVRGYHLHANDGDVGHIDDFVFDDQTWIIRYLIVSTKNWWPGKKILISPKWVDKINWNESKIYVDLSSEIIKNSPQYSDELALSRRHETGLHRHYNRNGYWEDTPETKENKSSL